MKGKVYGYVAIALLLAVIGVIFYLLHLQQEAAKLLKEMTTNSIEELSDRVQQLETMLEQKQPEPKKQGANLVQLAPLADDNLSEKKVLKNNRKKPETLIEKQTQNA